ncbi:MAG: alpha/beta hydrolase [Polaromonas sp.]|nr:alpha/beta hydrolase [Polaromonas sp.]
MSWLLLRGLTRETRHWDAFPGQLAQHTGEAVLALDLPGNGEFAHMTSPLAVHEMVDFVRHQARQRGLRLPCKLLAMSLGGMVATDWAQRYPDEVARLVLINTSMRPFSSLTQRLRPVNWLKLAAMIARWHDGAQAEKVIHSLTCKRLDTQAADIVSWIQIRKSAAVSAANAQRQLWAAARFACAAQRPICPTLLLSSATDQLVNPVCSAQLASAWQAEHQQHPWAGHDLPHDDGRWVCAAVAGR